MLRLYLLCLAFFVGGLGDCAGESFDCFVVSGARYWRLIYGISQAIEEIKAPVNTEAWGE